MSDDNKNYTIDELEFIDKAILRIGATVAAECIRRGPEGVAATTRTIVEAMVKERRDLRAQATKPTLYDAITTKLKEQNLELRAGGEGIELHPAGKTSAFDDGLVERLARVEWDAECAAAKSTHDKWGVEYPDNETKFVVHAGVHAILSELASMPCELPTCNDTAAR